jgi:elongation of very long chain fatty acids protein 6
MAAALGLVEVFQQWEASYDGQTFKDNVLIAYADVPFYAIMAYLAMVFWGQQYMKDRTAFNLKPLFIAWNLFLAVFSIRGAMVVVPYLFDVFQREGFRYAVCQDEHAWWQKEKQVGAWATLFCLSKIPELVDTVFLVFQKKPVIFLHWYHHTTVMLYCWLSYTQPNTVAIWFCAMNYVVHSIMYSYYFLMSLSGVTRKLVKPIGKTITSLQIAQMVVGMYLVFEVRRFLNDSEGCAGVTRPGNRAALVMYGSYFILFAKFFLESYVYKQKRTPVSKKVE